MRKVISILFACSVSLILLGQAPQSFKYQAVARDASGTVLSSQSISLRISILQGGTTGTAVYVETHALTTNQFGLVNLVIGEGSVVSGAMSGIPWGEDEFFVKIEMDPAGGTAYEEMGTSQLLSVPYALDAALVEQREFDHLGTTEHIMVGNGLMINKIYEINGWTDADENYTWIELPAGMTAINTRVLDVAIYFYVFQGAGVYYGQGYSEPDGTVGYTLHRSDEDPPSTLKITYPDECKGKQYRVTLMQVENSVVIE